MTCGLNIAYQQILNDKSCWNELIEKTGQLLADYVHQGQPWSGGEEVLKAYEFDARCAFLFFELVDKDYPRITSQISRPQESPLRATKKRILADAVYLFESVCFYPVR